MTGSHPRKHKWIKLDSGIRCREHPTRKHGVMADRYFVLRYTVNGKEYQEALGWASDGMTLAKARIQLAELKEAKRTGKGAKTLAEQRIIAEAEHKAHLQSQLLDSAHSITFEDFWEKHYWPSQSHKATGSLTAEKHLWDKWLMPVISNISIRNCSPTELEIIKLNMIRAKKSASTIKYAMAVISQIWSMALLQGIVEGPSPTKLVALPKKDNKRQRYLSKDEAAILLTELKSRSESTYHMSVIALDCGLRFGEIAALTWEDCDFRKEHILIRDPKSRANRFAFMTKRIKKILLSLSEASASKSGLIFLDKNGNKMTRISNTFRNIADELFNKDIDDRRLRVCFHTLRHTFASRLVEGGVSLYEVRELMGHSDFSMTQRYSHLSPEGLRNAIKILEE